MFKIAFEAATLAELFASAAQFAALGNVNIGGNAGPIVQNVTNHAAADPDGGPVNQNAPANDTAGLPWDERIHSGNRATNADGTWRKKRGVDAGLVAQVEMELRQRQQSAVTQQFAPQNQQPVQQQNFNPNAGGNFNPNAGNFQPNQQQNFQPNPNAGGFDPNAGNFQPNNQPPQQNFQSAPLDFAGLMTAISQGMQAGRITNEDIGNVCQQLQLGNIAMLQNNPVGVNNAVALLRQWGKLQ